MSDSLRIETVAEGIEDAEQAARMRDLGCTFGQGYYFARPMAPESIAPDAESSAAPIRLDRPAGTAIARYRSPLASPVGESSLA